MKRKPVIGETLYSLNIGNAARRAPQKLRPVKVVSIGKKYFKCQSDSELATEYHLGTWTEKTNYPATSRLYETQEEFEQEKEAAKLSAKMRDLFSSYGKPILSLDKLRRIDSIIEEKGE